MKKPPAEGNPREAVTFSVRLFRAQREAIYAAAAARRMTHPAWIVASLLEAAKNDGIAVPDLPDFKRRKYHGRAKQEEVSRELGMTREELHALLEQQQEEFLERLLASRKKKR
jgi:hypothetical protein